LRYNKDLKVLPQALHVLYIYMYIYINVYIYIYIHIDLKVLPQALHVHNRACLCTPANANDAKEPGNVLHKGTAHAVICVYKYVYIYVV